MPAMQYSFGAAVRFSSASRHLCHGRSCWSWDEHKVELKRGGDNKFIRNNGYDQDHPEIDVQATSKAITLVCHCHLPVTVSTWSTLRTRTRPFRQSVKLQLL